MTTTSYTFSVVTLFVNDKKGGWSAECRASRSDSLASGAARVEGQSSEPNAVKAAVSKAMAVLNKEAKKP